MVHFRRYGISTFWVDLMDFDHLDLRRCGISTLWDFDVVGFRPYGISTLWNFDFIHSTLWDSTLWNSTL